MGCAIILYLIGLYGEKYFNAYVFVENPLQILINPINTQERNLELGSIFTADELFGYYNTSAIGPIESDIVRTNFEENSLTKNFILNEPEIYARVLTGALNYYYLVANYIFFNHCCNNYLDVLSRGINLPTLLIGGKVSFIPWQTMEYQKKFYKDAQVRIFEADQGGSHLMFVENYTLFNKYLNGFLVEKHK